MTKTRSTIVNFGKTLVGLKKEKVMTIENDVVTIQMIYMNLFILLLINKQSKFVILQLNYNEVNYNCSYTNPTLIGHFTVIAKNIRLWEHFFPIPIKSYCKNF